MNEKFMIEITIHVIYVIRNISIKSFLKDMNKMIINVIREIMHEKNHIHTCRYCDKMFSQSQIAKKLEMIHAREKPYACRYCDKKFSQSQITRNKR